MIFQLDHTTDFPDPRYGHPSGFYAVGGDITPEMLSKAYPMGIFPYFSFRMEPVIWWAPQERFVIHADEIHISHSMRNMINKRRYRCTINEAFADVIAGCACADDRISEDNAWLGPELLDTWMELNEMAMPKAWKYGTLTNWSEACMDLYVAAHSSETACSPSSRVLQSSPSSTLPTISGRRKAESSTASSKPRTSSPWVRVISHMTPISPTPSLPIHSYGRKTLAHKILTFNKILKPRAVKREHAVLGYD